MDYYDLLARLAVMEAVSGGIPRFRSFPPAAPEVASVRQQLLQNTYTSALLAMLQTTQSAPTNGSSRYSYPSSTWE
jgi:hypothetical protein